MRDLARSLDDWVEQGFISGIQREAILQHERTPLPKGSRQNRAPATAGHLPQRGWKAELFVLVGAGIAALVISLVANSFPFSGETELWAVSVGALLAGALLPLAARPLSVLWDSLALGALVMLTFLYIISEMSGMVLAMVLIVAPSTLLLLLFRFDRVLLAVPAGLVTLLVTIRVWSAPPNMIFLAAVEAVLIAAVIAIVALRSGVSALRFWNRRRHAPP